MTIVVNESNANVVAQLLSALAQLLWPVFAFLLLYKLLPEVLPVLRKVLNRISEAKNLTIKVGNIELTFQEAVENIQKVLGSVVEAQVAGGARVSSTRSGPDGRQEPAAVIPPDSQLFDVARVAAGPMPRRILWVDNKPKGNAVEMAELRARGIEIDEATSTEEALQLFEPRKYAVVITNMQRSEKGLKNADAGIDLLKALRSSDPGVVVIAYCSAFSVRAYRSLFLKAGGNAITSSYVELSELLNQQLQPA